MKPASIPITAKPPPTTASAPPPAKVGDKRVKEPSSYANVSGGGGSGLQRPSLNQSFSNLSISDAKSTSHAALNFLVGKTDSSFFSRDRGDSNVSRESQTCALDRFVLKSYDKGRIRLSASVRAAIPNIEFSISVNIKDFGTKEWVITRSPDDIIEFCDSIRQTGSPQFPMPPPPPKLLLCVDPIPADVTNTATTAQSKTSTGDLTSSGGNGNSKSRQQKKRMNSTVGDAFKMVGAKLGFSRTQKKEAYTNVFPSVSEWFDAALKFWQRNWRSRSDEDGISLAFEKFLCRKIGDDITIPVSLVSAVDEHVVTVGLTLPAATDPILNRRREREITKAALREAQRGNLLISVDNLKMRVLQYAWARFEDNHANGVVAKVETYASSEQIQFMLLDVRPKPDDPKTLTFTWSTFPQFSTVRLNLLENISVPPTPKSQDHFVDVWSKFTDFVIRTAFDRIVELKNLS